MWLSLPRLCNIAMPHRIAKAHKVVPDIRRHCTCDLRCVVFCHGRARFMLVAPVTTADAYFCGCPIPRAAERSVARGPVGPIEAATLPAAITHLNFPPKSADRVSVPRANPVELENARGVGKT